MELGRVATAFMWLAVAWWLWSGHTEPLILVFGAASCAFALWFALRMEILDPESWPSGMALRFIAYVPWLLWQIAKANLHVARVIWSPGLPIRPRLVRVPTTQRSELGNAIYANSITLTPGTVSLDVRERSILVHALTDATREGLLSGEMDRRVTRVEGPSGAS